MVHWKWIARFFLDAHEKEMWAWGWRSCIHSKHWLGRLLLLLVSHLGCCGRSEPFSGASGFPLKSREMDLTPKVYLQPALAHMVAGNLLWLNLLSSVLILQAQGKYYRNFHKYLCGSHFPSNRRIIFITSVHLHTLLSIQARLGPGLFSQLKLGKIKNNGRSVAEAIVKWDGTF